MNPKLSNADLTSLGFKMYFYLRLNYSVNVWHIIYSADLTGHFNVHKSQASRAFKGMVDSRLVKRRKKINYLCLANHVVRRAERHR